MRIGNGAGGHLTYCTNIHPGESWPEVRANLHRYLPEVKRLVAPDRAFGVGLRLSAAAAEALEDPAARADLKRFLADHDLYVFTINGFPYGTFHGVPVKEEVYQPDWRDEARLGYTNRLADLLAELLPDDPGLAGSVSTVPGTFRPLGGTPGAVERIAAQMIRHAAHLVELHRRTGRVVALAVEPEPCCLLETVDETVRFFEDHLFRRAGAAQLAAATGLSADAAADALRRHLGVCLDLCHAAVEFEDVDDMVDRLRAAGIEVPKMQLSAGLRLAGVTDRTAERLRPFADRVYLHQVVERGPAGLTRYLDLPQALAGLAANGGEREWRVHFHVPIFLEQLGEFASTQPFLRAALARHRRDPIAPHLEVETYTWDVLPERYRTVDRVTAIARELDWVKQQLDG